MAGRKKHDDVDDFIGDFPTETQEMLQTLRHLFENEIPGAKEKISYGIPTVYNAELNNIVHYSAYGTYVGFYPGSKAIKEFAEELKPYDTSTGTIKFPLDKPLPLDLIRKITRYKLRTRQKKQK